MRAFGWTREELRSHSSYELALHWAVLQYEARDREKASLQQHHQAAVMSRKR